VKSVTKGLQVASQKSQVKDKKILITAGPTQVAIDDVRVISNIATGETGILLAEKLCRLGARVTLFIGCEPASEVDARIKLIPFRYFSQLKEILKKKLKSENFDAIIHNAAVSDFGLKRRKGKLSSSKSIILNLVPLPKITSIIRRWGSKAYFVIFKLQPGVRDEILIGSARKAMERYGADLVVANRLSPYRAFIIGRQGGIIRVKSKIQLSDKLSELIINKI